MMKCKKEYQGQKMTVEETLDSEKEKHKHVGKHPGTLGYDQARDQIPESTKQKTDRS